MLSDSDVNNIIAMPDPVFTTIYFSVEKWFLKQLTISDGVLE
jgi:hypothetical protein